MNIGEGIKRLRKIHQQRQGVFAKGIGITQSYLSQIERGHRKPSTELLEKIAEYINMPLPVMLWFCIDESDIHESKRKAYRMIKPSMDSLISTLI